MARKKMLIGAAVLLGVAIAVPATAAFAWGDGPPKAPPAPPAASVPPPPDPGNPPPPPTVVPDPVTGSPIPKKFKQNHEPPIILRTNAPKGWAPPPLPIPPGRAHVSPPTARSVPPDDQSPPPPPSIDLEPEDGGPN
jgi:hypothetical protein